jgi:hypothetical protein
MALFQSARRFVSARPLISALLSFVGLFFVFASSIAIIKLAADAHRVEELGWNAAMAFGFAFWMLVLGWMAFAIVRVVRRLFGADRARGS